MNETNAAPIDDIPAAQPPEPETAPDAAPNSPDEGAGFEPSSDRALENFAARLDEAMPDEPSHQAAPSDAPQQSLPPDQPQPQPSDAPAWLDAVPAQHRAAAAAVFQERQHLSEQLSGLRETVASTGMNARQLAELLDYGRLMMSGNMDNMRQALQLLDTHRAYICQQLGVESAAIDPLSAHEDLKKSVDDFTLSREHALEIARARAAAQHQQQQQAAAQQQAAQIQQQQAQQQLIQQSSANVDQYLARRAGEPGHAAKMAQLAAYFQNPQNVQHFVQTYQPQQWAATVAMMYDQMQAPAPAPTPAPLSRRATSPAAAAGMFSGGIGTQPPSAEIDRLSERLASLGI